MSSTSPRRQKLSGNSPTSDVLPLDFEQQIRDLEKELKSCKISVEKMHRLLGLYNGAVHYFAGRNEKKKNEYRSKYLCSLDSAYVKDLMRSRTHRYTYISGLDSSLVGR